MKEGQSHVYGAYLDNISVSVKFNDNKERQININKNLNHLTKTAILKRGGYISIGSTTECCQQCHFCQQIIHFRTNIRIKTNICYKKLSNLQKQSHFHRSYLEQEQFHFYRPFCEKLKNQKLQIVILTVKISRGSPHFYRTYLNFFPT